MATSKGASTPPIARLAHPLAFGAFLHKIGAPRERLFGRLGLPVHCNDPGVFVPLRQAWALFDAAARLVDPAVGWHVGRFCGDNGLSAGLRRKLRHAPTLYQALRKFVRLVSAEASHLELGIVERPDEIVLYTQYSTVKDWPGYSVSLAYQLEVYLDLIRHYAGPEWVPRQIGIEGSTVPRVVGEHFPGSRVFPNQRMGYLTVPRSCLHLPARRGDHRGKEDATVVLTESFDFVDTLGAVLEPHLAEGYPSQRLAASLVDTSVRTLARRLSDSGVSYQTVIDRLRLRVAKKHLLSSDAPIFEVAFFTGFHDPANFTRMFRRVAGLSPQQFRREARSRA